MTKSRPKRHKLEKRKIPLYLLSVLRREESTPPRLPSNLLVKWQLHGRGTSTAVPTRSTACLGWLWVLKVGGRRLGVIPVFIPVVVITSCWCGRGRLSVKKNKIKMEWLNFLVKTTKWVNQLKKEKRVEYNADSKSTGNIGPVVGFEAWTVDSAFYSRRHVRNNLKRTVSPSNFR